MLGNGRQTTGSHLASSHGSDYKGVIPRQLTHSPQKSRLKGKYSILKLRNYSKAMFEKFLNKTDFLH